MKECIKKMSCLLFFIICLIGCFTYGSRQVQAATKFKIITLSQGGVEVGGVAFYVKHSDFDNSYMVYYQKGTKRELLASDWGISTTLLTDGKTVYYSIYKSNGNNSEEIVYEKKISTGKTKRLFSASELIFAGYYGNKIYYTKNLDPGTLCSYDVKNGKNISILNDVTEADQYGNVFLCTPYVGGGPPFEFLTYNAKTNKSKWLTKKLMCYEVIKKQIYYVEYVRSYDNSEDISYNDYICNLVRCDMNGKQKKILLKNQRIQGGISKITSSYIVCNDNNTDKTYKINY